MSRFPETNKLYTAATGFGFMEITITNLFPTNKYLVLLFSGIYYSLALEDYTY